MKKSVGNFFKHFNTGQGALLQKPYKICTCAAFNLRQYPKLIGWSFVNILSESVKGAVALLTNTEERGEARLFLCKELAKMEAGGLKSLRQKLLQNIGTKKYEEEYWKFFQTF